MRISLFDIFWVMLEYIIPGVIGLIILGCLCYKGLASLDK